MDGASEYWNRSEKRIAIVRRRTDRLRPVEFGERDPRHVVQIDDAVLQKQ